MKNTTKIARQEIKNLIMVVGLDNILNKDITEITNRTGVTASDCVKAMDYYRYRR